jgi:hypothetical protein
VGERRLGGHHPVDGLVHGAVAAEGHHDVDAVLGRRPGQRGGMASSPGVLDGEIDLAAQGSDQHVPAALIRRGGFRVNHQ